MAVSIIHDTQGLRCYLLHELQSKLYIALQKRDYTAYSSFLHLKTDCGLDRVRKIFLGSIIRIGLAKMFE